MIRIKHLRGMRMIAPLFLVASVLFACSASTPAPPSFVFDLEDVLDAHQELALDSLFRDHERRTGNEIALVTHPSFHGRSARDFAVSFGDSLGVGKKDSDNGVVIAFSQARREVFIATGRGTERILHDSICKRIVDEAMLPRFKEGHYFKGLKQGAMDVVAILGRAGR